jgi:hypothetical protein
MDTFRITYNRQTIIVPIDVTVHYLRRRFSTQDILGVLLPNGVEYDLESTNNRSPLTSLDTVLITEESIQQEIGLNLRKVKIFVSTGYHDCSGDPKQAKTTALAVETEYNTWIQQQGPNFKILDVQVNIDSKQHGNLNWHGACVSSIVVHYSERRP